MRKIFINAGMILGFLAIAASPTAGGNPPSPPGGFAPSEIVMAPEIRLKDMDGIPRRLSDYRGKVVLLHFWACWCQPCQEEFPKIKWLEERMRGKNFVILTIAADNREAVAKFVIEAEIALPVLIDQYGSALRSYAVKALPSSYLVDKEGRIQGVAVGSREWNSKDLLDSIDSLMGKRE